MKTRTGLILAVATVAMLAWSQQAMAQGSAMWDRFWGGRMSCPSSSSYRPGGYQPSGYQHGGYQGYQPNYSSSSYRSGGYQPSGYQHGGYQGYQQGYRPNYSPPRYSSGGYWGGGRSGGVSVNVGDLFSPRYGSYGGYGSDGSPAVIFVETPRQEPMSAGPIIVQQPSGPQIVQQPVPQIVQQVPQMPSFPPMPPQIIVIQQPPPPAQPQIIQQPVQAPMAPPSGPIFVIMGAPAPAAKDANAPAAVAIGDSEETLLRQFANSEDGSRKKVAKKLARFPTSLRVKMILIEAVLYDQDEDVRQEAAKALGKMKARMALDALQQVADEDKDDDVKEAAAEAIEKIRERPEPPVRRGPAPPPPPLRPLPRTPAPTTSPS